jgi:hypothetical protein
MNRSFKKRQARLDVSRNHTLSSLSFPRAWEPALVEGRARGIPGEAHASATLAKRGRREAVLPGFFARQPRARMTEWNCTRRQRSQISKRSQICNLRNPRRVRFVATTIGWPDRTTSRTDHEKYETKPNSKNASRRFAKFERSAAYEAIALRRELAPRKSPNEAKFAICVTSRRALIASLARNLNLRWPNASAWGSSAARAFSHRRDRPGIATWPFRDSSRGSHARE